MTLVDTCSCGAPVSMLPKDHRCGFNPARDEALRHMQTVKPFPTGGRVEVREPHPAAAMQSEAVLPHIVHKASVVRAMPVSSFVAEAEAVVNSQPVLSIYAACEWDELDEDGKLWVAGIVREALARATERR